jgi:translation initiation factor eIF-2B subunit alpha
VLQDLYRFLTEDGDLEIPKETQADNGNESNNDDEEDNKEDDPEISDKERAYQSLLSTIPSSSSLLTMKKPLPVAVMQALLGVAQRSQAGTMMGLQDELQQATQVVMDHVEQRCGRCPFSLWSASHLLVQYSTRTFLEWAQFEECRQVVVERGLRLCDASSAAHGRVVHHAHAFFDSVPPSPLSLHVSTVSREGLTILTHGHAHMVDALMEYAATRSPLCQALSIVVLEGRPLGTGIRVAQRYATLYPTVPVHLAVDASLGYWMEQCTLVLVGAEAVLEHGGILHQVGTYPLAVCAHAAGKPLYVAAESYKFARLPTALYPLSQSDAPHTWIEPLFFSTVASTSASATNANAIKPSSSGTTSTAKATTEPAKLPSYPAMSLHASIDATSPVIDFTPAQYITLLFTDLGVLTPSAVSDELIRLYQ